MAEKENKGEKRYKQSVVYEYLKNSIITGKLPPEKQLVEQEICDKLGVSRTPVREAIRMLTSDGLVDFSPGKGAMVATITKEKAADMYELKEALEAHAARLCAERNDPEVIAKLEDCLRHHKDAYLNREISATADIDLQFHILLLEGSKSSMLEEAGKSLLVQARRLSQLAVYDSDQTQNFIAQHEKVLDAIKAGDGYAAARAISEHIRFIKDFQWKRWAMLF